ncbi:MAG: Dabb family protein [Tepidisphaeraceae bacterium]
MNHAVRAVCLTLIVFAASCQSSREPAPRAKPRAAVTHVVLCWLKTPEDEVARQKLIDTSRTFETIPGVVSVTAGRALPSTRPVVDSSFDVAIVITFTDDEALRAYDGHPTHVEAVENVLKPIVARFLIYDFEDDAMDVPAR